MHRILWSEEADADLDTIYEWMASEADPETALRYMLRIEAAAEKLADFPNRGSPRDEIRPRLRSVPFARSVTIFYTVGEDQVLIVHVIHARRDTGAAFQDN
jgi:toxin ParE1/3/4